MSARYPLDPFALPDRPDIALPAGVGRRSVFRSLLRGFLMLAGFGLASVVIAVVLFVPILMNEIGQIETVVQGGRAFEIAHFLSRLGALFFGTLVFAVAFMSILASAALAAGQDGHWRTPGSLSSRLQRDGLKDHAVKMEATYVRSL